MSDTCSCDNRSADKRNVIARTILKPNPNRNHIPYSIYPEPKTKSLLGSKTLPTGGILTRAVVAGANVGSPISLNPSFIYFFYLYVHESHKSIIFDSIIHSQTCESCDTKSVSRSCLAVIMPILSAFYFYLSFSLFEIIELSDERQEERKQCD